jgi:hypothetical protein
MPGEPNQCKGVKLRDYVFNAWESTFVAGKSSNQGNGWFSTIATRQQQKIASSNHCK